MRRPHGPLRAHPSRSRQARGFSLLELVVTIGILSVALVAIGDIQGGALRNHAYARQLTTAVQLARGKMLDLQAQLRKDGLSDFSKEFSGDFDDEGAPGFRWTAQIIKPEMEIDPKSLVDGIASGMGFGGGGEGSSGGAQAANPITSGPFATIIQTQATQMIETLKSSVREVKLRVYWKSGMGEESFEVVEHIVQLPNAKDEATALGTAQSPIQQQQSGTNPLQGGNPMLPGGAGFDFAGNRSVPGLPGLPGAGLGLPGGGRR